MDNHNGSCRKLVEALEQLMPGKFNFEVHRTGPDDECFRSLILQLMKQAARESYLSTEYAIACQQVIELFEPVPGDQINFNLFKYLLSNQCEIYFSTIRKSRFVYKSHDDYVQFGEELKFEKNVETYKRLKKEQSLRFNSRELAIGTIRFIAELYNVSFLNSRVMELCMKNLLHPPEGPTELDVECFCILLTTIGSKLEITPKGSEVIEKYLGNLEEIVDSFAESFVLRIRCMILDVFELRANNWKPLRPDQVPLTVAPENKVKDASEFIEAARETREFLKEVSEVLSQLGREKLLDFMYRFMDVKYTADRLEGATKIIFERAISSQETSMFALVCKGLAGVVPSEGDGAGDQVMVTFKEYLLRLIRSEIDMLKNNVVAYRGILQRLEALKREGDKKQLNKMKADLEKDFKLSSRAVKVSSFVAELYNADFIESRFIFDEVFIVLLNQKFVSDASIECFCKLVKLAGTKMMTEKNRDKLMKEEMMRLFEGAKNIEVFPKTKFMIQDIISFTRFQMKLPLDNHFAYEINEYPRLDFPWNSTLLNWSNEPLDEKNLKRIRKKKQPSLNQSDDIKYEAAAARQFAPPQMPSLEYNSKVPPPIVPPTVAPSSFAVHTSVFDYFNQVPNRLYMNNNLPNAQVNANGGNSAPVPIDFSQEFINPTMMSGNYNNFY